MTKWKDKLRENGVTTVDQAPDIPMVGVYDENDHLMFTGWYFGFETRQVCPMGDRLRDEDVKHCVAHTDFADWNMRKSIKFTEVTPPHYIKEVG